jgi:opacity protein-like surface antigen
MNKTLTGCATAMLLACCSNAAFAGYVGIGFGDTAADIASSSGQNINYTSTGMRLVAGNQISPYLSVEAEYIDLGKFTSDKASIAAKGLGLSGLLALPMSTSFSLFGKAGLARIETTATANPGSVLSAIASDSRIGLTLSYGVQLDVSPNATLRISWDSYKASALVGPFTDRVDMKSAALLIFKF